MAVKERGLSISLILVLLLGAFSSPVAATELTDAEQQLSEVQNKHDLNLGEILLLLPSAEADAKECVRRLAGSTNSADVTTRVACEQELARVQSEINTKTRLLEELKAEMSVLESRVQTLRASSGSTQSSGSASSSSGGSSASNTQSSSPTANSSTQTSETQSSQSTANNSATASPALTPAQTPVQTPAPTPAPTQNTETQAATSAPTPSLSPSPSAVSGSKVSATPKPVVKKKKKTITCIKGKVTRKVTAVKPVCPKGFKVKKKK
jgi:hypothetical protein